MSTTTYTYEQAVKNIARKTGIDETVCAVAVNTITKYYEPSGYEAEQIASTLNEYLLRGEENRAMVVLFRQETQAQQSKEAAQ